MQDGETLPEKDRPEVPEDAGAEAIADAARVDEYTAVEYAFDENTNVLSAVLTEAQADPRVSWATLQEQIKDNGYHEFLFIDDAINQILDRVNSNERGTFPIAARKHAGVVIKFSDDDMEAYLSTTPAYGGEALTVERLEAAISAANVVRQVCDAGVLEKVLTDKSATDLKFAEGKRPRAGVSSHFIQLVDDAVQRAPTIDESGTANQYDLQDFTVVEIGTPLIRRIPATKGVAGCDVKGKTIPAPEQATSKDLDFAKDNPGAIRSPDDPNTLVAEIKGHPVFSKNGVRVDNTLRLDHVDLRTGNISFDGSVTINGDVTAGTIVAVTGDVEVKGVIVNATVSAGNDIVVRGGIVGPEPEDDDEDTHATRVTAAGNVEAKFASQAVVEVGGDFVVREYVAYCEVAALGQALVGQQGGRGWIFGGHCHADGGIAANALGTDANVVTLVTAGYPPELITDYDTLSRERQEISDTSDRLSAVLEDVRVEDPPDENKIQVVASIVVAQHEKIRAITTILDEIDRRREAAEGATIATRSSIYPNVTIGISGEQLTFKQESKGGCFSNDGDELRKEE